MPRGNFTKQWIKLNCSNCNTEFQLSQGDYNHRLKRGIKNFYCSPLCRDTGHRQEDIRDTKLICAQCAKDFTNELDKYVYNRKAKSVKEGGRVFCSISCTTINLNNNIEAQKKAAEAQKYKSCPQRGRNGHEVSQETKDKISEALTTGTSALLRLRCDRCGKEFVRKRWIHNMAMKRSDTGNVYCSNSCAATGREVSQETRDKIRLAQYGISKPQSGVSGRVLDEETRIQMSLKRAGIPTQVDWDIVKTWLKNRNITKYSLTRAPIPDAIWMEDGKIVALELEKKPWFTAVKKKMDMYKTLDLTHHNGYDKIYLSWHTLDGVKRQEWIFENGEWTMVWSWKET